MPALEIGQSPPVSVTQRFLSSAPWWGVGACALLALLGPDPWTSRWHPGVLALVHMLMLGVIGNACMGALLQFLSAAAASRPRGNARFWAWLHATYNLGVLGLCLGLVLTNHLLLQTAAMLLAVSICVAMTAMLRGLIVGHGERLLRLSLAAPLVAWCIVAALGVTLVWILSGRVSLGLETTVDVHALVGIGGVLVLLLVAVARVVLPMLLGVTPWRTRPFMWIYSALVLLIMVAVCWRSLVDEAASPTRLAAMALFAVANLALIALFRRERGRNRPLASAWGVGLSVILAVAAALAVAPERAGLAALGVLLGLAMPLLILSTLLEISAFIGWIDLHTRCGKGVHVPGVHLLMPDGGKWRWLAVHCAGGLLLLALLVHPTQQLASLAGASGAVSYVLLALVQGQARRRARRFLSAHR